MSLQQRDFIKAEKEIKRLREALEKISKPALGGKFQQMIARQALEDKEANHD